MNRFPLLALWCLPLAAAVAACAASDVPPPSSLVVGVQSEELGSLVDSVGVAVEVDGVRTFSETLPSAGIPREIEVAAAPGARVSVTAVGVGPGGEVVRRVATTRAPGGGNRRLLRVMLEARCVSLPNLPVACAAPNTCVAGACVPTEVGEAALEDYEPGWAAAPPDICRPAKHGPPEVILGTGQTDYGVLNDEQTLMLESGPQGGHHLWIAARMRNLRKSGSTTTISSVLLDDPEAVPPSAFVFTFDRDEGGYCKLWGLRYQVDSGASDLGTAYKRFLGKRIAVTVEVADTTGAKAKSTRTIRIADKLLCADGTTTTCNTP